MGVACPEEVANGAELHKLRSANKLGRLWEILIPHKISRERLNLRALFGRQEKEALVEWILFISLQWIVLGSPPPPSTQQIGPFASEELCVKAADAIRAELNTAIPGQRVQTFARLACFALKTTKGESKDSK
jgi:hypothetical protein